MKKFFSLIILLNFLSHANAQNTPIANPSIDPGAYIVTNPTATTSPPFTTTTLHNYVREWVPIKPVTNSLDLTATTTALGNNAEMTTTYYGGTGKPIQQISRYVSNSSDIVTSFDNRLQRGQLSFLPYPVSPNSKFKSNGFIDQKNYYDSKYPYESSMSMSEVLYTSTPRSTKQYAPGVKYVGQERGTSTSQGFIPWGVQIINWGFDFNTYQPVFNGFYTNPESLIRKTVTSVDGKKYEEYRNKLGNIVCKRSEAYGTCGNSACPVWLTTYYIYDNFNRVIFQITPKATEKIISNGNIISSQIIANLCYYYKYDEKGRLYERHIAGDNGNEFIVYDKKDRVVLRTKPGLNKYEFTLYDKMDRVIVEGLYPLGTTADNWQYLIDNNGPGIPQGAANDPQYLDYYIVFDNGEDTYPASIYNGEILAYYYYDNYDNPAISNVNFDANQYAQYLIPQISGSALGVIAPEPVNDFKLRGRLTGKKTKVLKTGSSNLQDWIIDVYFYDRYGNNIQAHRKNATGGWDIFSTQYNFKGQPLTTIRNHSNPFCATKPNTSIVKEINYFLQTLKLSSVQLKIDQSDWTSLSSLVYDDFGKVIHKSIGGGIEVQKYNYDIRDRLIGINEDYISGASSSSMTFGEAIKYEDGFQQNYYNGNISGIIWKGAYSAPRRAYGYSYDPTGRLTGADFSQLGVDNNGMPIWNKPGIDYTVSNVGYDANGNIHHINRKGVAFVNGSSQAVDMDNLIYSYEDGDVSNKVQNVTDNNNMSASANASYGLNDFIDNNDPSSSGANDYAYSHGNLTKDLNKGITNITYNHLYQPVEVTFNKNGVTQTIKYTYSADGTLLREEINDGTNMVAYDYVGPIVYKSDGTNYLLHYLSHDEGRARYHDMGNGNMVWDYDFFVKDHLGNIRNVLTAEVIPYHEYIATHEIASAGVEEQMFSNIGEVREDKPGSTDPADLEAAQLNAAYTDKVVGTALLLHVAAGDKFELSADSYYESYSTEEDEPLSAESIMGSIIGALVNGNGGGEAGEGGSNEDIINAVFSPENFMYSFDGIVQANTDPSRPKSYLNYMLLNEEMQIIPEQSGVIQIGAPGQWSTQSIGGEVTVGNNGYLAVWISTASTFDTYYDNLKIKFTRGKLLEEQHYYPYGLVVNALNTPSNVDRLSLYQSKEWRDDLGLMWYNFHARQYDPQLGRFTTVDPAHQFASGYIGMGNNPAMYIDPNGEFAVVPIVIGAVIGAYMGGSMANGNYNPFQWDYSSATTWGYMLGGAMVGGVSGGVGHAIATSGIPFANTAAVAGASLTNSLGTHLYTDGQTDISVALGFASYNFTRGEFGYFGKKGNSALEDIGYGLGALANMSDILAGFRPGEVTLRTENDPAFNFKGSGKDPIGHSQTTIGNDVLIDWGPTDDAGLTDWLEATNSYKRGHLITNKIGGKFWDPIDLKGVNIKTMYAYSRMLNKGGEYNLLFNSCVSQTSRSLNVSGVFNIGIHPYILHAQMYLRSIGARPMLFSHFLTN